MDTILALGYTNAYVDPVTGGYPLGNGYRMYLPELMRFTAPDDLSPFGPGGMNPYVYCDDDPINGSDSTGHFSLSPWAMLGIVGGSIGLGMLIPPFLGPAIMAEGGIGVATAGITSSAGTIAAKMGLLGVAAVASIALGEIGGIASAMTENANKGLSQVLGITSGFLGVFGAFASAGSVSRLYGQLFLRVNHLEFEADITRQEINLTASAEPGKRDLMLAHLRKRTISQLPQSQEKRLSKRRVVLSFSYSDPGSPHTENTAIAEEPLRRRRTARTDDPPPAPPSSDTSSHVIYTEVMFQEFPLFREDSEIYVEMNNTHSIWEDTVVV